MFKLLVFISTLTLINAARYGSRVGLGKSLVNSGISGGLNSVLNSGRLVLSSNGLSAGPSGAGYVIGNGGYQGHSGPISAAIQTHRTVEVVPVHLPEEPYVPQIIEVPANELPVNIIFRSQSSRVLAEQVHTPGSPGEVQETRSEDEPHHLRHEIIRPVIQELREIIQPYRRVVQQIQPVIEEVHSIVARGEPRLNVAPVPVAAVSSGISSPVVAPVGGVLSSQNLGSLFGQNLGSLFGQNLGSLYGQNLQSSSGQKLVVPIGSRKLGGALSGLTLDNGMAKGLSQNLGTNFILMSASPVSFGLTGNNLIGSSAPLDSVVSKETVPALGVSPPRINLGGASYMAALSFGSGGTFKLLDASSAAASKAKASAKAA